MKTYDLLKSNTSSRTPYLKNLEDILNNLENIDYTTGYNNQIKMIQCGELLLKHCNANDSTAAFCAIEVLNVQRSAIYGGAIHSLNIWKEILDLVSLCLPNNAYIGRVHIGFAIHIWEENIEDSIETILEDIQQKLERFNLFSNNEEITLSLTLSSKIGYVVYPCDTGKLVSYKPLTQYAAIATTGYINRDYPSNIKRYCKTAHIAIKEKITLESNIFNAIKTESIMLSYQPQINLKTKRIIGAETLTYFSNHVLEANKTKEYIDIIENSKYITLFTKLTFNMLVDFLIKYESLFFENFHISFNLSRAIFKWKDFDLFIMIEEALKGHEHLIKYIQLEITESAYTSKEISVIILESIHKLNNLGFSIAIDDFGTGYSSLSMITSTIPDVIKLDKEMTKHICNTQENNLFIISLVHAANHANFTIIAEGIETQAEEDRMKSLAIYTVQGYKYSKNLKEADFIKYLKYHKNSFIV